MAYRTSSVNVWTADAVSRASQVSRGTSGPMARAVRTSSSSNGRIPSKQLSATMNGASGTFSKYSMAGKQSASRRGSARTTAPSAPRIRSSHKNQNRSWPGVPNRYRASSSSRLTRPKSMATVVVTFSGVAARSSVAWLASVIRASVVTGSVSEIDLTNVVLPTPNPPAMTILVETAVGDSSVLDGLETTKNPFEQHVFRPPGVRGGRMNSQPAVVGEITDQDADHTQRYVQVGGDLRDRAHRTAQRVDVARLGHQQLVDGQVIVGDRDQRFEQQWQPGDGPAAGDGVGPDPGASRHDRPPHDTRAADSSVRSSRRICGVSTWPEFSTSRV